MSVDAAPVLLDLAKTLGDPRLKIRVPARLSPHRPATGYAGGQRLAMCEEAMQLAQRDEERKLAAEVADIAVKSGSSRQGAGGNAA